MTSSPPSSGIAITVISSVYGNNNNVSLAVAVARGVVTGSNSRPEREKESGKEKRPERSPIDHWCKAYIYHHYYYHYHYYYYYYYYYHHKHHGSPGSNLEGRKVL